MINHIQQHLISLKEYYYQQQEEKEKVQKLQDMSNQLSKYQQEDNTMTLQHYDEVLKNINLFKQLCSVVQLFADSKNDVLILQQLQQLNVDDFKNLYTPLFINKLFHQQYQNYYDNQYKDEQQSQIIIDPLQFEQSLQHIPINNEINKQLIIDVMLTKLFIQNVYHQQFTLNFNHFMEKYQIGKQFDYISKAVFTGDNITKNSIDSFFYLLREYFTIMQRYFQNDEILILLSIYVHQQFSFILQFMFQLNEGGIMNIVIVYFFQQLKKFIIDQIGQEYGKLVFIQLLIMIGKRQKLDSMTCFIEGVNKIYLRNVNDYFQIKESNYQKRLNIDMANELLEEYQPFVSLFFFLCYQQELSANEAFVQLCQQFLSQLGNKVQGLFLLSEKLLLIKIMLKFLRKIQKIQQFSQSFDENYLERQFEQFRQVKEIINFNIKELVKCFNAIFEQNIVHVFSNNIKLLAQKQKCQEYYMQQLKNNGFDFHNCDFIQEYHEKLFQQLSKFYAILNEKELSQHVVYEIKQLIKEALLETLPKRHQKLIEDQNEKKGI